MVVALRTLASRVTACEYLFSFRINFLCMLLLFLFVVTIVDVSCTVCMCEYVSHACQGAKFL